MTGFFSQAEGAFATRWRRRGSSEVEQDGDSTDLATIGALGRGDRRRVLDLLDELIRRGYPQPTREMAGAFGWEVLIRDGDDRPIPCVIAIRFGEIPSPGRDDPLAGTGEFAFYICTDRDRTGRGPCRDADKVEEELREVFKGTEDALLALFGLKHDWGFPGAPVVSIDDNPDRNERAERLKARGYY